MADPGTRAALWLTIALLGASNVIVHTVLPSRAYLPWNLALTALVILISVRLGGLSAEAIGLGASHLRSGLRWGAAIGAGVAFTVVTAALVPGSREWFVDDLGREPTATLLGHIFVTIPFGTVVLEEVAFRGCLPALADTRPWATTTRTVLLSSSLFGLWHVLPSLDLGDRNDTMGSAASGWLGETVPVLAAVSATAVAGAALLWVRRRSGSVVAPALIHWALNASATAAAWIATR